MLYSSCFAIAICYSLIQYFAKKIAAKAFCYVADSKSFAPSSLAMPLGPELHREVHLFIHLFVGSWRTCGRWWTF